MGKRFIIGLVALLGLIFLGSAEAGLTVESAGLVIEVGLRPAASQQEAEATCKAVGKELVPSEILERALRTGVLHAYDAEWSVRVNQYEALVVTNFTGEGLKSKVIYFESILPYRCASKKQ